MNKAKIFESLGADLPVAKALAERAHLREYASGETVWTADTPMTWAILPMEGSISNEGAWTARNALLFAALGESPANELKAGSSGSKALLVPRAAVLAAISACPQMMLNGIPCFEKEESV